MGQARELMDRATQAVLEGDLERLREIYAPDVVVSTPDAGTLDGIDAFIGWNRAFIDAFSDRSYHSERALETQECAIDQGEFIGTHTMPLQLPRRAERAADRQAAQAACGGHRHCRKRQDRPTRLLLRPTGHADPAGLRWRRSPRRRPDSASRPPERPISKVKPVGPPRSIWLRAFRRAPEA